MMNIMKPDLFLLLCLSGVVLVNMSILRPVHHKYYLIDTNSMTWADARNYCRENYDDIAAVGSDADWIRLRKEEIDKGLTTRAWVGLYNDRESWRWSFNDVPLKNQTLKMWTLGEPNNGYANEECAGIDNMGEWSDYPCADLQPFICFISSSSGPNKIVGVASPPLSWFDAQTYCRTYYTDLASSTTTTENNILLQVVLVQGKSWFGLYRDSWKWVDRTFQDATNLEWLPGQPNNGDKQDEDCGVVYSGVLMDRPCYDIYPFFCHTVIPTRIQQIVKLQVNSDESVFEPAVQSVILKQIEQKLEEHGMLENTTVTWRLQPNGNIFERKKKDDT